MGWCQAQVLRPPGGSSLEPRTSPALAFGVLRPKDSGMDSPFPLAGGRGSPRAPHFPPRGPAGHRSRHSAGDVLDRA